MVAVEDAEGVQVGMGVRDIVGETLRVDETEGVIVSLELPERVAV